MGESTLTKDSICSSSRSQLCLEFLAVPRLGRSGEQHPISGDLTLGRSPGEGGLLLDDPGASRRHAVLRSNRRKSVLELIDLGSKNGTYVNGASVQQYFLSVGDMIRIGDSFLHLGIMPELQDDPAETDSIPELVGTSPGIRKLQTEIEIAASGNLPILILGETGSGKELAAQAVHRLSARSGPFLPVNCPAVPETLFESVFFGHRRGAFTDAREDSLGLIRSADRGTLFLDEIGELGLRNQARLLRFLEDGVVMPVGSASGVKVDVQLVAATNANLTCLVEKRRFREDLLARLEGFVVEIPALRYRKGDIPGLVHHFAREEGVERVEISPDALEALLCHRWPKNVRSLKSLVRRLILAARHNGELEDGAWRVEIENLSTELQAPIITRSHAGPVAEVCRNPDGSPTREGLLALLSAHGDVVADVARSLNRDRKQVYRWMKKYDIDR